MTQQSILDWHFSAGDITCLATIPPEIQAEAQFLAKDTGIVAGIAMASLVFQEVDPSLKVFIYFSCFVLQWIVVFSSPTWLE